VVHPAQREALTSLKHIVVGSDFSELSAPAIDAAAEVARLFEARVTLMHVYDVIPPVPVLEDELEKLRASRLDGVPSAVKVLRDKSTVTALCEWADDHEVDLIALGTHGRTGAARLLLGSVAERTVRHAPCAVLVVKPSREPK
jgi:nucleotide-binding universal stress UspA family protein